MKNRTKRGLIVFGTVIFCGMMIFASAILHAHHEQQIIERALREHGCK